MSELGYFLAGAVFGLVAGWYHGHNYQKRRARKDFGNI
jgi:hypothetical protein